MGSLWKNATYTAAATSENRREPLLDFRLSHANRVDTRKQFENQLNDFLLRVASRRHKTAVTALNATVSKQRDRLVSAVRAGSKISSPTDLESFFNQQYIRNAFVASEDQIVWDSEQTRATVGVKAEPTGETLPLPTNPRDTPLTPVPDCISHETVLDFRLSHGGNPAASKEFENQLNNFLLRAANRRRGIVANSLCATVARQLDKFVAALRSGRKVTGPKDVEPFFNQQYIRNAFLAHSDLIIWDGELQRTPAADGVEPDWTFCWSKRRVWTLRQVFTYRAPVADDVLSSQSLLPPVHAKLHDETRPNSTLWQCSTQRKGDEISTTVDVKFPEWITDDCSVTGSAGARIHLRQFLHQACQPFHREEHLHARNTIYYLVMRNLDYARAGCSTSVQRPAVVQVYVGKAGNGVIRRWLRDRWAHCLAVRDVLEARERCLEFEDFQDRSRWSQLVDCYLAMGLLRHFDTALFVIKRCYDAMELKSSEASLIHQHDATNMSHGLNCRKEKV